MACAEDTRQPKRIRLTGRNVRHHHFTWASTVLRAILPILHWLQRAGAVAGEIKAYWPLDLWPACLRFELCEPCQVTNAISALTRRDLRREIGADAHLSVVYSPQLSTVLTPWACIGSHGASGSNLSAPNHGAVYHTVGYAMISLI